MCGQMDQTGKADGEGGDGDAETEDCVVGDRQGEHEHDTGGDCTGLRLGEDADTDRLGSDQPGQSGHGVHVEECYNTHKYIMMLDNAYAAAVLEKSIRSILRERRRRTIWGGA